MPKILRKRTTTTEEWLENPGVDPIDDDLDDDDEIEVEDQVAVPSQADVRFPVPNTRRNPR